MEGVIEAEKFTKSGIEAWDTKEVSKKRNPKKAESAGYRLNATRSTRAERLS
jgi:hypothetical protein